MAARPINKAPELRYPGDVQVVNNSSYRRVERLSKDYYFLLTIPVDEFLSWILYCLPWSQSFLSQESDEGGKQIKINSRNSFQSPLSSYVIGSEWLQQYRWKIADGLAGWERNRAGNTEYMLKTKSRTAGLPTPTIFSPLIWVEKMELKGYQFSTILNLHQLDTHSNKTMIWKRHRKSYPLSLESDLKTAAL